VLGLITLTDLLKARTRHLEEEERRERVLRLFPASRTPDATEPSEGPPRH
jgi:hypothetical protein